MENLLSDDKLTENVKRQKIFFIETHQNSERSLENPRQACSVESAAITNPDLDVYFIFVTNTSGMSMEYSDLIDSLQFYGNINLRYLNPIELAEGTILEDFFHLNAMNRSKYPIEHMADVLRVLILNKFGGQYLDLDIFSIFPLSVINKTNFACPESNKFITNAVINLDLDKGALISSVYLKKLYHNYDPKSWGGNGPTMLTDSIKTFCPDIVINPDNVTNCGDYFTILPRNKCYPIMYGGWKKMFEEKDKNEVMKRIAEAGSYFIHVWNKMEAFENTTYKIPFTSQTAYIEIAQHKCPQVYKTMEKFFF